VTTLVTKERAKPKDVRRTTVQVIQQVEGEFRVRGYGINLSKNTINWYLALGMVSTSRFLPRDVRVHLAACVQSPHTRGRIIKSNQSIQQCCGLWLNDRRY